MWSVSTILKHVLSSQKLENWIKAVGEDAANTKRQVAADRGNRLHDLCERYLRNESLSTEITNPQFEMFMKIKPIIDEHIDKIYGIELAVHSEELQVAGTLDLLCEYEGALSIVDWKNTQSAKAAVEEKLKKYYLQCVIYALLAEEFLGRPVEQVVVIFSFVVGPGRAYKLKITDAMRASAKGLLIRFNRDIREGLENQVLF